MATVGDKGLMRQRRHCDAFSLTVSLPDGVFRRRNVLANVLLLTASCYIFYSNTVVCDLSILLQYVDMR